MAMNSVDSSKGRLRGTYIAIMIPLGVAINYVGGQIATSLGLPIYLDSIGTIIVASIMGPWIGATSGVLYNIISSLVQGNIMASLFGLCNIGSGLIVGYMARYGKYKNILHVIIATVLVSLWNSIVAAPISMVVYGGIDGNVGTNLMIASLRGSSCASCLPICSLCLAAKRKRRKRKRLRRRRPNNTPPREQIGRKIRL